MKLVMNLALLEQRTKDLTGTSEVEVSSQESYESAANSLFAIAELRSEVEETFSVTVQAAHQEHKRAVAERKNFDEPLAEAERVLREKIAAFTPKYPVEGISPRETWTFEVEDADAIPREFLIPDEKRLKKIAKAQGAALMVPGLRAKCVRSIAVSTKDARANEDEKKGAA